MDVLNTFLRVLHVLNFLKPFVFYGCFKYVFRTLLISQRTLYAIDVLQTFLHVSHECLKEGKLLFVMNV